MNSIRILLVTLLCGTAGYSDDAPQTSAATLRARETTQRQASSQPAPLSALVVRGGHKYDTPGFENMCNDLGGIHCDLVLTAHFDAMDENEIVEKYDAILFLNQNKRYTTSKRNRRRYLKLAELGVGMVFLHFTLSSEPEWDEYHDLIGGKWFLKTFEKDPKRHSTYFTDMTVAVKVLDPNHPTTSGLNDFTMTDAFYGNIFIAPDVHSLLGATHPDISHTIAWTHTYGKSKVVYLMPGFTNKAYENSSYRKFLENSLAYVATP